MAYEPPKIGQVVEFLETGNIALCVSTNQLVYFKLQTSNLINIGQIRTTSAFTSRRPYTVIGTIEEILNELR